MDDEKLYNVYGIIHTEDGEEVAELVHTGLYEWDAHKVAWELLKEQNPKSKYDDSYYVRADQDAGPFMRKEVEA